MSRSAGVPPTYRPSRGQYIRKPFPSIPKAFGPDDVKAFHNIVFHRWKIILIRDSLSQFKPVRSSLEQSKDRNSPSQSCSKRTEKQRRVETRPLGVWRGSLPEVTGQNWRYRLVPSGVSRRAQHLYAYTI